MFKKFVIDTSILVVGETYFLRYTINDGVNAANTTYPNNQTSYVYKSMWSFTVQQMKKFLYILILIVLFSCKKEEEVSEIPIIDFVSISPTTAQEYTDDTFIIT